MTVLKIGNRDYKLKERICLVDLRQMAPHIDAIRAEALKKSDSIAENTFNQISRALQVLAVALEEPGPTHVELEKSTVPTDFTNIWEAYVEVLRKAGLAPSDQAPEPVGEAA